MGNMLSNNKTQTQELASGISRLEQLPSILQYPKFVDWDVGSVRNIFSYIIKHYGNDGLSVLLYRQKKLGQVVVLFGDWRGNKIDITGEDRLCKLAMDFTHKDLPAFVKTLELIRLEQAQFFFAVDDDGLILVDMQVSLNKMAGPGMIRDIFGKVYRTQEAIKIEIIDERAAEAIIDGKGSYSGDLIIKPTRFRLYHESQIDTPHNTFRPLYVEVRR
jgi:hypothetical protein